MQMPVLNREKRTARFTVDVEPSIDVLMECVLQEQNMSKASYIRSLIIKDLNDRDLLTKEVLLRIVV